MRQKKFLIVIPARKGSKRLKNKNILKINGKSLIQKTIDFALKIKNVKHILISSDINNINKHITLNKKVLIPWLRPKELSADKSKTEDVLYHAVNWYKKKFNNIDGIVLLQTTSPIRSLKLVNKAIAKYLITKKSVLSVKKITLDKKNAKGNIKKKNQIYYPNGSIYIFSQNQILEKKEIYNQKSNLIIENNYYRNIDIDHKKDFDKAKKFITKNLY